MARRRRPQREEDSAYVKSLRQKLPVHERLAEVVASADDPHPRKTRRIKWIGDYNPMDDAKVLHNLIRGAFNPMQAAAIRRSAAFARTPSGGLRHILMEAQHEYRGVAVVSHLNRTYYFQPPEYICQVDYQDVDVFLENRQFIDLDDPKTDPRGHIYTADEEVWKLVSVEVMDRDVTKVPNHLRVASN